VLFNVELLQTSNLFDNFQELLATRSLFYSYPAAERGIMNASKETQSLFGVRPWHFAFQDDDDSEQPPWALFYNIYLPFRNDGADDNVRVRKDVIPSYPNNSRSIPTLQSPLEIVREQLGQIADSFANNANSIFTVYYNTIGNETEASAVSNFCGELKLRCVHMGHYADGAFEEVTLERVREYCSVRPAHRAIYLHSKGTYHNNDRNAWWRRHMTAAVTRMECLEPQLLSLSTKEPSCNLCGLLFTPLPWHHFSGNFFVADCRYINKLLPIDEYRTRLELLAVRIRERLYNSSHFVIHMFRDDDAYLGLGRFASEHWPGSHPDLVPCDLSRPTREIKYWKSDRNMTPAIDENRDLFEFKMFPPSDRGGVVGGYQLFPAKHRWETHRRIRELYLLAGNVYKWMFLYNATPRAGSWVWDFYPDAEAWQRGFQLALTATEAANKSGDQPNLQLYDAILDAVVGPYVDAEGR